MNDMHLSPNDLHFLQILEDDTSHNPRGRIFLDLMSDIYQHDARTRYSFVLILVIPLRRVFVDTIPSIC